MKISHTKLKLNKNITLLPLPPPIMRKPPDDEEDDEWDIELSDEDMSSEIASVDFTDDDLSPLPVRQHNGNDLREARQISAESLSKSLRPEAPPSPRAPPTHSPPEAHDSFNVG